MCHSFTIAGWYISKTGTNPPDCGRDQQFACATLTHLWQHLEYAGWRFNDIKTDTDLFIADMYLHSPHQKLNFYNLASHMINITITNTIIEQTWLDFNGNNISIHIENSFIQLSWISSWNPIVFYNCNCCGDTRLDNTTSSEQRSPKTMGLDFCETIVEFYNCNFSGITTQKDDWFDMIIYCEYSNITMVKITVRDNKGHLMKTEGCNVQVTFSDFRNNNGSGLLWVNQRSKVHVTNSTFTLNQGLYRGTLAIESSHLTTVGCQFLRNTAKANGAAIYAERESGYNDYGSLFADHTAGEGGKVLIAIL